MKWFLGYSDDIHLEPEEYIPAFVPSDVQLIYGAAKGMRDYHYADGYKDYKWMEDKWWFYKTTIYVEKQYDSVPILEFEGLNYRYTILLNGKIAVESEGLYTPVHLNLSSFMGKTVQVTVVLHPIPKREGVPEGKDQASLSCIPPVAYGWDWHPRLVPIGIYRDVTLKWKPSTRIDDVRFFYNVTEDLSTVNGHFEVYCQSESFTEAVKVSLVIFEPEGEPVFSTSTEAAKENILKFEVINPKLWWCANQGPQHLYSVKIMITKNGKTIDQWEKRIGFRRIRLVMNADGWEGPRFPKTQGYPPATIELNGRKIFGKGTNFLPPEILTSKLAFSDIYERLVMLAKNCNMNLLRIWGGGIIPNDRFFDACDQAGIMVWQEFPLSCNNYPDVPQYLNVLEREAKSIILRLKYHPCVILWCGGNELLCSWSGMTNQSHALRLLNAICWYLDPYTPFIMSSPQYGIGHGGYLPLNEEGNEMLSDFASSYMTAYVEFGIPSPSPLEYIYSFTPDEERGEPKKGTAWETHHAVGAWSLQQTWFCMDMIRSYYGTEVSIKELVDNGIELQSEILKQLFETIRRKWPRTSLALNWCFNEPWPTAANNSIVNYPDIPKKGYYGVQASLRDRMLSAGFYKMRWKSDERAEVEIYLLNDTPEDFNPVSFAVFMADINGKVISKYGTFLSPPCPANSNVFVVKISFNVPCSESKYGRFRFILQCEDPNLSSEYLLYVTD